MENVVFIVTSYGQIVEVFSSQEDAAQKQREVIAKNRPADIICRAIVQPLKPLKK